MYRVKIYHLGDTNEYEYCYRGNYGARGEKRVKKAKVTSEYQAKLNQKHKEKYMRRLIRLNFREGDLWVTLQHSLCRTWSRGIYRCAKGQALQENPG